MNSIWDISFLFVAYIAVIWGNGILVKVLLRPFTPKILPAGMPKAGPMIGYLERTLIFTFLLINQPTLIGFILTIKAIYRYGDIQGDNSTKMQISEYFIIGTLTSVLLSVITYVIYTKLALWD